MTKKYKIQPNFSTLKLSVTKTLVKENFPLASKLAYLPSENARINPVVHRIHNFLELGCLNWEKNKNTNLKIHHMSLHLLFKYELPKDFAG
ncbi:hypothetical protein BB558_007011 [Smittium angustum]|uniref:Uncharacterized protein n=1 Tax=Smittium angustum TaxID=133377 RepID=A0A2U1IW55_SMIAN|nr:hypothetical protein BB558_007011 [Smittium angustum]